MDKIPDTGMFEGLVHAKEQAERESSWVVVVTPTGDAFKAIQWGFASIAEGKFSGRTALVGQGKLSVVHVKEEMPTRPFDVHFVGWGRKSSVKEAFLMGSWRKGALASKGSS